MSAIVFISLLVLNVLAGLIFTDYQWINVGCSSLVLLFNYLFIVALQRGKLKDAFKVSLSFILPFIGIIEFVLATVASPDPSNNVALMTVLVLLVFQLLLFLSLNFVSQKID